MSVVLRLIQPLGRDVDGSGMTYTRRSTDLPDGLNVTCCLCPRELDAEQMMRADITLPGESRSVPHFYCPPCARRFKASQMILFMEIQR